MCLLRMWERAQGEDRVRWYEGFGEMGERGSGKVGGLGDTVTG
jgi:hypothetical protein